MLLEWVFWGSVTLIVYAYAGYPLALGALSVFRRRPVQRGTVTLPVSIVITAHNEENALARKIENALGQDYPGPIEIIVASDCSTDRTDLIARSFAPRVRLVRSNERKGKEAAQQLAVAASSGEVLIFTDVATMLAPDGVSRMLENFADATVGCVSSSDRVAGASGRVSGEGAYVRYEMYLRTLETTVNSLVGLSGSFFGARRQVCRSWASDRQSDFNTLLNAVGMGWRGVLDPRAIGVYPNVSDERREFQRKVRTVVRGLYVLFARREMLNPLRFGLFSWQLASHKVCRWLVPFAMAAAALANTALAAQSPFYLALLVGQGLFYAIALAGLATGSRLFRLPAYFCVVNVGILTAWLRFARGERIAAWTPSTRITAHGS
jgi:glycosyltransferase involved in cell wall biosynthesis